MRILFQLLHILIYPQCRLRKHIYTQYNKVTLVLRFQTLIAQKISSNKIKLPYTTPSTALRTKYSAQRIHSGISASSLKTN